MSRIIATGSYLPSDVVSNDELISRFNIDSSDEWIVQRTGIKQRHFAQEDETLVDLAYQATEKLLERVDNREEILDNLRLVIVASSTSASLMPTVASQVLGRLGVNHAWGYDMGSACSSFVLGLETINALSKNYDSGYSLLIGAEVLSRVLDPSDRSTNILFGDGAGAILIENDGEGLLDYTSVMYTESDLATEERPDVALGLDFTDKEKPYLTMKGRDVFDFVIRKVVPTLKTFIEDEELKFDYLIAHQANSRLLKNFEKKLDLTSEQVPEILDRVANTSAASVPILMDALVEADKIKLDGSKKVIASGYGGGLTWGHSYFRI